MKSTNLSSRTGKSENTFCWAMLQCGWKFFFQES